ncbi:hypothetical protein GCM10009670_15550 [Citricoccus alkalitolerans]
MDAVHMTAMAYLSSANRALHVNTDISTVIAGWNSDTTIWLTDAAREWYNPRQEWQRSIEPELVPAGFNSLVHRFFRHLDRFSLGNKELHGSVPVVHGGLRPGCPDQLGDGTHQ